MDILTRSTANVEDIPWYLSPPISPFSNMPAELRPRHKILLLLFSHQLIAIIQCSPRQRCQETCQCQAVCLSRQIHLSRHKYVLYPSLAETASLHVAPKPLFIIDLNACSCFNRFTL